MKIYYVSVDGINEASLYELDLSKLSKTLQNKIKPTGGFFNCEDLTSVELDEISNNSVEVKDYLVIAHY